jgi:hypothetical protein
MEKNMPLEKELKRMTKNAGIKVVKEFIFIYDADSKKFTGDEARTNVLKFILGHGGTPKSNPLASTIIFSSSLRYKNWVKNSVSDKTFLKDISILIFPINTATEPDILNKINYKLQDGFEELLKKIKSEMSNQQLLKTQ